jgi:hypothetical protein
LESIKALQEITANDVDVNAETGTFKIMNNGDIEEKTVAELLAVNSNIQEIEFNGGGAPI